MRIYSHEVCTCMYIASGMCCVSLIVKYMRMCIIIAERISARQYLFSGYMYICSYVRTYVRSVICAGAYE